MEQLLTKLKTIEPSKEFQKQSRLLVLSAPQNIVPRWNFLFSQQYKTVFAAALFSVFAVLTGISIVNKSPASQSMASNFDQEKLNAEVKSLDINIQLSQAQYYQDSAEKIEVALNETSDEYDPAGDHQQRLDALLNELIL